MSILNQQDIEMKIKGVKTNPKPDILLINCPPWDTKVPPLGTAYISSYSRAKGLKTLILDLNILLFNEVTVEHKKYWDMAYYEYWTKKESFQRIFYDLKESVYYYADLILKIDPLILGFSVHESNRFFATELIKLIKKQNPRKIIIAGGPGIQNTRMRGKMMPGNIDIFVIGEGEEISYEIIKNIKNGLDIKNIPGIIKGKHDEFIHVDEFLYINKTPTKDLNAIPFPTFDEFNLELYSSKGSLPMLMSRGCVNHCTFCNDRYITNSYRYRTAQNVFEEIKYHVVNKKTHSIFFMDLLLNGNAVQLNALCDLLIASNINILWFGQAIPRKNLTKALLTKMKKAGCHSLTFGVESFSNNVLKIMHKGFTKQEAIEVIKTAKDVGINVGINIITGFPGETEDDFNETIETIKEYHREIDVIGSLNTCCVNHMTDLNSHPQDYGLILPEEPEIRAAQWRTVDNTNNYDIRIKRSQKIFLLAKKMNIPLACHNLKEKDVPLDKKELTLNGILNGSKAYIGPKMIHLDLTNECNNDCIGCWCRSPLLGDRKMRDDIIHQTLPFELISHLIDDLEGIEYIKFVGGGEPLMHPDILKIVEYAKKKNIECEINTNFTLINEHKLKHLAQTGLDIFTVSLWAGTPETYKKVHPNKTEKTFIHIQNILNLLSSMKINGKPKVTIYNVLLNQNYDDFDNMLQFALNVRADSIQFTLMEPIRGKTEILLLNENEKKRLIDKFRKLKETYDPTNQIYTDPKDGRSIVLMDFEGTIQRLESNVATIGIYDEHIVNKIPCYVGWLFARVLANGDVIPCCKAHRLPLGNLYKNSFKEIWHSEKYNEFRYKAKYLKKADPYFLNMGNEGSKVTGCYNCDNLFQNIPMHEKVISLIKDNKFPINNIDINLLDRIKNIKIRIDNLNNPLNRIRL
jgi:radical SAM superfamily enzyme YgiQ (UPF0313 family)